MNQIGKVAEITTDGVVVTVARKGACGDNCAMCGSCRVENVRVDAICTLDVKVGDTVELSSSTWAVILGLLCLFVLPIFLPLTGYIIFSAWVSSACGWIVAAVGLAVSIVIIWRLSHSKKYLSMTRASVARVIRR